MPRWSTTIALFEVFNLCSDREARSGMMNMTNEKPAVKIRLKRLGETPYGDMQWSHAEFVITRRQWCLPITSTTYDLTKDGKLIDRCDTLRDVRDCIAMIREEAAEVQS